MFSLRIGHKCPSKNFRKVGVGRSRAIWKYVGVHQQLFA